MSYCDFQEDLTILDIYKHTGTYIHNKSYSAQSYIKTE